MGFLGRLALLLFVWYFSPGICLREFAGRVAADGIARDQKVSRG